MKTPVNYNPEIIDIISKIVNSDNPGVKLEKSEDGSVVSCNYKSATYNFHIDFPSEMFNFDGNEVNFYNFQEFSKIVKTFKSPSISMNDSSFFLDMEKSSIEYILGDPNAIKKGFSKVISFEPDVSFIMSNESIKNLNSCKGLFGSEFLTFVYDNDTLKATLKSKTRGDNKYEEYYNVENSSGVEVDIKIFALVVPTLSLGDWIVDISNDGLVRFTLQNNNGINLNLYCMKIDD